VQNTKYLKLSHIRQANITVSGKINKGINIHFIPVDWK